MQRDTAASHPFFIMKLQEIFFGTFTPPKSTGIITHKIGMSGGSRYVPHAKRVFKTEDGLNTSENLIQRAIKTSNLPVTAPEISKLVNMTHSHCGMVLCSLYKKNLLKRKKVRRNGIYMYEYTLREKNAS